MKIDQKLARARCLDDRVVYAIGDIHGRLDLFDRLIDAIRVDLGESGKPGVLIPLGDYIDRGPESRGVIERLIALTADSWAQVRPLRGNHEQLLLDFLQTPEMGRNWMPLGGLATLAAYGVGRPPRVVDNQTLVKLRDRLRELMPRSHIEFMEQLPYCITAGDYFFVHAGVRPRRPLAEQRPQDMLWIRDSFLREPRLGFNKVFVHGHSTSTEPMFAADRIGIDTGAYATGVLTCLRLEGAARALISVEASRIGRTLLPDG